MSPISGDLHDFLSRDPEPVGASTQQAIHQPGLPTSVVNRLMQIQGVDGVWIEQASDGSNVVVIYFTDAAALTRIPSRVEGLAVKAQLGEPIRALKR